MSGALLGYLAGFFDGEGWVTIALSGGKYTLQIGAANIDTRPLLLMQERWGGSVLRQGKTKLCWSWRACSDQAYDALREMLPYLIVKRGQAEIAMEYRLAVKRVVRTKLTEADMSTRERYRRAVKAANVVNLAKEAK